MKNQIDFYYDTSNPNSRAAKTLLLMGEIPFKQIEADLKREEH